MSKASSLERLMLDLVNQERREAGLDPLRLELRLNDSAEDHSEWMLDTDKFSHTGQGGSSAGDRMRDAGFEFSGRWTWGENIALQSERGAPGLADDVRDLHEGLMDSPGHRANILNPSFELLGIGIERGDYKGFDAVMVTQNFASTSAPVRIDGGSGGGAPDPAPQPQPEPEQPADDGSEPELTVADFSLKPGQFHRFAKHVTYEDAEGDAALRYEIDAPDGARVVIDRETVDASDGFVFDADDLATAVLRFNASGEDQTFRLRADDGDGWSDWDAFTVSAPGGSGSSGSGAATPRPTEGGGLEVEVDDIVLRVGERAKLADHLDVTGGTAKSFKIVDPDGGPGLWMAHRGEIDASDGLWIGAAPAQRLYLDADDRASTREMRILVTDGEERSGWETFTVTTEWDGV